MPNHFPLSAPSGGSVRTAVSSLGAGERQPICSSSSESRRARAYRARRLGNQLKPQLRRVTRSQAFETTAETESRHSGDSVPPVAKNTHVSGGDTRYAGQLSGIGGLPRENVVSIPDVTAGETAIHFQPGAVRTGAKQRAGSKPASRPFNPTAGRTLNPEAAR